MIMDATVDQLRSFYGDVPPRTCRTWTVLDGLKVIGVCGYIRKGGGYLVFADITPELRAKPRMIIHAARKVLGELREKRGQVKAICDHSIPAAARFLEHFNFHSQIGGEFVWLT